MLLEQDMLVHELHGAWIPLIGKRTFTICIYYYHVHFEILRCHVMYFAMCMACCMNHVLVLCGLQLALYSRGA